VARTFNGSTDKVSFGAGAAPTVDQSFTLVLQFRATSVFIARPFGIDHSTVYTGFSFQSNSLQAHILNGSFSPSSSIPLTAGASCLAAISKTSGLTAPRFHLYDYSSDSWVRGNGSSTTSGGSNAVTGLIAGCRADATGFYSGDIGAGAVYAAALSDDQLSTLPYSFSAWLNLSPAAMLLFDQSNASQAVIDLSGNGANQNAITGTTVSANSVPILSYGHPVAQRARTGNGPQLLARYVVPFSGNNANTLTTPSFTPVNGEVIVVKMQTWTTTTAMGSVSGGSQTWTSRVVEAPGGFNGWAGISTTTITGSPGSMTVSATPAGSCGHGMVVERWGNASLATTPAVGSGTGASSAPSATVTTAGPNSVVSWLVYDNNNRDPSTRAYRSSAVDEALDDQHVGTNGVTYYAYQQAATAGAQTFGLTAPSTTQWVAAAIEIQAPSTGGIGTTLTAQPGGAAPAATAVSLQQGAVLANQAGGTASAGARVGLNAATRLTAAPSGALSGGTSPAFTSATAVAVQSAATLTAGTPVGLSIGSVVATQPGTALPSGSGCTLGVGTPLTVAPGGSSPAGAASTLNAGTVFTAQAAAVLTGSAVDTLNVATLTLAGPAGAIPGGAQAAVTIGVSLTAANGATAAASNRPSLTVGTVLTATTSGTTPAGTFSTVTVGSATATNTQPGGTVGGAASATFTAGMVVVAQPGGSQAAGAAATFTIGTPGTFTLTAAAGGTLAAGSQAQQTAGTVLSVQPGTALPVAGTVAAAFGILLAASSASSLSAGTRASSVLATALTAIPGWTFGGAGPAVVGVATVLAPIPAISFTGAGQATFIPRQALLALTGGSLGGGSPVAIVGSTAVIRRPGSFTAGSRRSILTPGSRRSTLTAGTRRGPDRG
jgi:hypothetical protein